ncbi:hypothetical protein [Thioalkalivibrio versutus]|nr:hypothetical protein [Thioalkalivibrio versutus]
MSEIQRNDALVGHLASTDAPFQMAIALVRAYPLEQQQQLLNALHEFGGGPLIETVNVWIRKELMSADLDLDTRVMTWLSTRLEQILEDQETAGDV